MLLYLVYDKKNHTVSHPLVAPSMEIAKDALKELNPENLSDLIIHPLLNLDSTLQLFQLSLDSTIDLPDFTTLRSAEVTPSATQQPEGVSDSQC